MDSPMADDSGKGNKQRDVWSSLSNDVETVLETARRLSSTAWALHDRILGSLPRATDEKETSEMPVHFDGQMQSLIGSVNRELLSGIKALEDLNGHSG